MSRTTADAHKRLDQIEPRVTRLETENNIQFKEIVYRLKRLELFLVAGLGAVIVMLGNVLLRMG